MYQFEKNKLYSYLGNQLVDLLKTHKCYIAGGTITSLFCNREINDVDVYFKDEASLVSFLYDVWDDNIWITAHTKKATLIQYDKKKNVQLQLVHFSFFDSPETLFNTFDFTACMGCFDFETEEFVLHDNFMQHNSQRILKFNPETAYPIVSLLRVQKYKEKGYKISKPEFLRIALSCMDLDIKSYDELKEHLGGMYGINYDKLLQFDASVPFNLETAIEAMADLSLDEDYFKEPENIEFDDVEEIVQNICHGGVRYCENEHGAFIVLGEGKLKSVNSTPKNGIKVDCSDQKIKLYKFVSKKDGLYTSFYDKSYEYRIGEYATPKKNHEYLYFNELEKISHSTHAKEKEKVLLEVEVEFNDVYDVQKNCLVEKCFVIREVPVEEYQKYLG